MYQNLNKINDICIALSILFEDHPNRINYESFYLNLATNQILNLYCLRR
jgi:hypothetical protein